MIDELIQYALLTRSILLTCTVLGYYNFLMDKNAYVPYVRTCNYFILLEYSQKNTQYPCTLVRTF